MSKIDGNSMAFPSREPASTYDDEHPGMTIRTWLAGQVISGYFADPYPDQDIVHASEIAVKLADATIKALNAAPQEGEDELHRTIT